MVRCSRGDLPQEKQGGHIKVHHHEIHSFPSSLFYSKQDNQEELQTSIQVPFGVDNPGGNIQRFVSFYNAF